MYCSVTLVHTGIPKGPCQWVRSGIETKIFVKNGPSKDRLETPSAVLQYDHDLNRLGSVKVSDRQTGVHARTKKK
jgi:hypothetical protein